MFDTILNPSSGVPRRRWSTTFVSAFGHAAIIVVLVLTTMYATDTLPDPPDALTYVMVAPPPPPPPPPPAPPAVEKPAPKPEARPVPSRPAPVTTPTPQAVAPVEAPDTILPETGREGGEFAAAPAGAGFEKGLPGGVIGGTGVETAPPAPPPAPVRIGGSVKAPRLAYRVEPEYPEIAVSAMIEGIVILEATVDPTGAVKEARVLRSHGILDRPAIDAVKQWKYEPLLLNGVPTPFVLTVTVSFGLGR